MVGQMISLNQLDQLISINQTRHRVHRHRNDGVGATSGGDGQRCCALLSQWRRRQHAFTFGSRCRLANQLPFDPNTMMPLNSGNAGAMGASINSFINPASMGSSSTSNNTSGGK